MHPNSRLVEQLYTSVGRRAGRTIADYYHPAARFRDIAFDLRGREQIAIMWAIVCAGDIRVTFEVTHADDETAIAKVVDEYTFTETGRPVRNLIESRFRFRDGLILEHLDSCDPRAWAAMAIGGIGGFVAGRSGFLRRWKARRLMREYRAKTPTASRG